MAGTLGPSALVELGALDVALWLSGAPTVLHVCAEVDKAGQAELVSLRAANNGRAIGWSAATGSVSTAWVTESGSLEVWSLGGATSGLPDSRVQSTVPMTLLR